MIGIGFILLVSSCGFDDCDALPVSDDIYPTHQACEAMLSRIKERRPDVFLLCGEVYRDEQIKPH